MDSRKDPEEKNKPTRKPSIYKWLRNITEQREIIIDIQLKKPSFYSSSREANCSVKSLDIPSRVLATNMKSLEDERTTAFEKYGEHSIVTQMYFQNTSKNISLSSSDYLVPKFEYIDFNELKTKDFHQLTLENSRRNLEAFQRSHKKTTD